MADKLQDKKLLLIDSADSQEISAEESSSLENVNWEITHLNSYEKLPLDFADSGFSSVVCRLQNDNDLIEIARECFRLAELGGSILLSLKIKASKKKAAIALIKSEFPDATDVTLGDGGILVKIPKSFQVFDEAAEDTPKAVYLSADINPNISSGYYGCLDQVVEEGVFGWLINATNLGDPVALSMYLEDELIGTAYSVIFRADISIAIDKPVKSGVHFKWKNAKLPAWVKERKATEKLTMTFVVENSQFQLRAPGVMPTYADLRKWVGSGESPKLSGSQKKKVIQKFDSQHVEAAIPEEIKAIAFYLPQYHPVPENDEWWGPGFTEWSNVTQAKSLFEGHYQPHVPADLGYYDLRLAEVREAQAQLAKAHGIHGFCYYYYWFAGRRILERPLQEVLDTGKPDFPFCICWANENWSRRWDGSEHELLLKQEHSEENDIKFIHDVIPILKDPRYIKVNGKPILIIYRLPLLPNPAKTAELWRKICRDEGVGEIYLCVVESFGYTDPYKDGFDAAVQFPPHDVRVLAPINNKIDDLPEDYTGVLYDYEEVVFNELNREAPNYKRFRGVMCSWDNTARKKKAGNVFLNATPKSYELWLRGVVDYTRKHLPPNEQLVFINAWNEWAEGTHLEPDRKFGKGFLEATKRAIGKHTDWKVLIDYAKQVKNITPEAANSVFDELEMHLRGYDQALRYLSKSQKPLLRNMTRRAVFVPESKTNMNERTIYGGGESRVEQIGSADVSSGFEKWILDKDACVYLSGWTLAKNHKPHEHTLDYFVLEGVTDREQFAALAKVRYPREDIVQVKNQYSREESLYSGFRVYLDFTHIKPGEYRLGILHMGNVTNTISFFDGVWVIV